MRLPERKTLPAIASLVACFMLWCAETARGNINVEFRPLISGAIPNANVNFGLYFVSDSAVNQFTIAADIVFGWNNTHLQFLGIDDTGGAPVSASFFPADNNLNEVIPPQDGNGFYQMLGQFGNPIAVTPTGTLITTFKFKALSTSCTGANLTILASAGNPLRFTRVLSGIVPNLNITGTLGSSLLYIDGIAPIINTCAPAQIVPAGVTCQGAMPNLTGLISATDNCPNLTITQTPLAGTTLALGPHAVQIQVKDPGNNIANCNTTVTVVDQAGPTISQCASDQTLAANASCQAALPNLTAQVLATDTCSPPAIITQSPAASTLLGLGPHTVTFTATDAVGNTTTCQATVTVADQTAPHISTCVGNQTLAADATCEAQIPNLTAGVAASDNCTATPSLTIAQSPTAGTTVGLGPHNVTFTVTDAAGNTATCLSTVTVTDQTAPHISACAGDQTLAANASCQAAIPNLTGGVAATDNCTATLSLGVSQSPNAGTLVGLGPHSVTFTVTDAAGNTATCHSTVTVTDQTAPQISSCPGSQTLAADASCEAEIPDLTAGVVAADNCTATPSLAIAQSPTAGTTVGLGPHNVTFTVTDAAGNTANCQTTVTVTDQAAPQITTCAGNQTLVANASCQAAIPNLTVEVVAADNCTASASLTITQSPLAGTLVGLGPHIVTLSVKDAANNEATCQATMTVVDQTNPSISQCAADQTIAANAACQAALPNLTGSVVASDNCTPANALVVTQSPPAGGIVGLGPTLVTITVKDAANNEATCQATVTVEDQTAPNISQCASNQTVAADENRLASIPNLTASVIAADACSTPVIVTQSPLAGTIVGLGPHNVTFTATDAAGNTATCMAVVNVADLTSPVISQCAPSPTLAADLNCQAMIPDLTAQVVATDTCSPPVTVTQSPLAGTIVGIGPHTVTFTATDFVGNSSTCDAVVHVEDQTAPDITTCAGSQTIAANASCQAAIPDLTGSVVADDACSLSLSITQSPIAGTLVGLGPHAVTLTVKDAADNEATCQATITVEDQTDPQITTCAGPVTIPANASCQAQIPDLTSAIVANDNCTPAINLLITQSPTAGTFVGLGPHNVTITVADAVGNDTTCIAVVTVADQTDPLITTCAGAQTIAANASCQAAIPDLTGAIVASDNCTAAIDLIISQSPLAGTMVGLGPHNVTITVADLAGNDATCIAVVTVEDQTDPDITTCAPPQTIAANASCEAAIPDLTGSVVASDNCTAAIDLVITQSPTAGTMVGLGPHNVTLTVADLAGNDATCVAVVTVADQTAPVLVGCPGNIVSNTNVGNCAAVVNWTPPTANDNCGTPTVTRTQGPAPGSTFAANSVTTIEYTATDAANNSVTCSFTVTVTPSPDMDNDGDVDVSDMPIFINVLLGIDTTPLRVARADVNCDGSVNGRDIQPFVDILTP